MAMSMRRYGLVARVAQMGIVASVGCGVQLERDPLVVDRADGSPGATMPGQDAGAVTPGGTGTWIAFDSDGAVGNRDLYVIRADGTGRRRLTTAPSTEVRPSFSRDGTKLAFASDRDGGVMQVYLMDLATGVTTRVTQRTEGANDPAFTIDGTRIGYRSGFLVFTAMLDGRDERQISVGGSCCAGEIYFGPPVFPSDGRTTIYDDYNAVYSTSDGTTRQPIVMPTTGEQSHPTLSPDGSTIALQATCIGDNAARSIWTVPATGVTQWSCSAGTRLSALQTDATHPSWGPNDTIVWGSVAGGTNSSSPVPSALVTWQGGALQRLPNGGADDRNPSWSPADTFIGDW
jgi:Tol biopolymer transport system component